MKLLRNIGVGFLVSYIGSLPLGYLNVIGFHLFQRSGLNELIYYLIGVGLIEAIVIYISLAFARKLADNKKLLKYIEVFSILFMLMLAAFFAYEATLNYQSQPKYIEKLDQYHPFVTGLLLSGLNFIQIPFWVGWSLYLINSKYINTSGIFKYVFVLAAAVGTFGGMLCFVLLLSEVSSGSNSQTIIAWAIPCIFFGMALFGIFTYYKKRRRKTD